jgi:crossover junction endodeoxyribonuclease RuvC
VIGLDPGLANLGLGAVREASREVTLLGSALVRTSPRSSQAERLLTLYEATEAFIVAHRPDAIVIEGQYFHQQRDLAFKVGQAVGVALLAAARHSVPVFEYGPLQVKQALVGSGRASKAQVTFMVRAMLKLPTTPDPSDAVPSLRAEAPSASSGQALKAEGLRGEARRRPEQREGLSFDSHHVADALALALTHLSYRRMKKLVARKACS